MAFTNLFCQFSNYSATWYLVHYAMLKVKFPDSINRNRIYIIYNFPMGIAFRE